MWNTTETELLISIPITLILVVAIYIYLRKINAKMDAKGCGCGILGLFYIVFLISAGFIGCHNRAYQKAHPKVTTTVRLVLGGEIEVADSLFIERDTIYIKSPHVYKNDTGRKLVQYMVKYSTSGTDSELPIGIVIEPNEYFFWYDDEDHRMFQSPPAYTSVRTRRGSGLDFKYLHFLDYTDNVENSVRF